jgi:spoIIIJ-associated protein
MVSLSHVAAPAQAVEGPRQEKVAVEVHKLRETNLATAPRPNLIVDGKLNHAAITTELRRCLDALLQKSHFQLTYEIKATGPASSRELESPEIVVEFKGQDQGLLLERNAELLLALEHISLRWLWLEPQFYGRIRFDSAGYRGIRIEELKLSARVAAGRVRETHAPFRFNAMSSRERRILHLVLKEEPGVRSESEGTGEDRQVVVYPA